MLTIAFTGAPADRHVEFRICPVTGEWSRGPASWETTYVPELYSRSELDFRSGSGVALFDVTVPLKEVLEDGLAASGFVLLARSPSGGLPAEELDRFGDLTAAELRVSLTGLPSGRPPRTPGS